MRQPATNILLVAGCIIFNELFVLKTGYDISLGL